MRPPKISEQAGILVITFDDPSGLNDGLSDAFRQSIYDLVQDREQPRVAADLSPVDYLSSSGLAALIGLKRRVDARKGRLVLFHLQPYVQDVMRVTKVLPLFNVVTDRDAAFALLSTSPA